jgi:hypothetical protein
MLDVLLSDGYKLIKRNRMIQFENAVKRYRDLILDELKEQGIKCWLAGGAIRDYFMGEPVKTDYDIFFPNEIEYEKTFMYFKAKECEIIWESDNGCKIKYKDKKYDLIKKYFPDPQKAIEEFDFTVSMLAVDTEKIYFGDTTFIDLAKRQLMINKITHPASTLSKAFRYYKKGFSMCLGEMKKVIESIQEMPKEEPKKEIENVLENKNNEEQSSADLGDFFFGID